MINKLGMLKNLAIMGGPKAVTSNKIGWPNFDEKAIKSVEDVLRSGKVNYWTGPKGMEFEKKFAEWQGSKYAISVATRNGRPACGFDCNGYWTRR